MPEHFAGFALPTSNTTYTPNQFFDVCVRHSSRGVVRLVGHMIRQTLGWCDPDGKPQTERHALSYADLENAGISRDMINAALKEAIAGHFIRCVQQPQSKGLGRPAATGLYELQWDESGEYIKDPKRFRGFFAGEGNRTYIPNQFFDVLLPSETLATIKVVGSIIRFSIGFANKWGHRRRNVPLSYQHIQNYSRLGDRRTVRAAIAYAMESNYIQRVEEGYFDPDGGKLSKAAVYALKWLNQAADEPIGQKTPPADRSENPTGIEIKHTNKTLKQQDAAAASFEKLRREGFDENAAQAIASRFPAELIDRQIAWIDRRNIRSNRLGMLRAAIEQDWSAPGKGKSPRPGLNRPTGASFADALADAGKRLDLSANRQST